jgi:hypothetical protein
VPRVRRRQVVLCLAAGLFVGLAAPRAHAGSYLERAALLLEQARREGDVLMVRHGDKELVAVVRALTDARVKAARKMSVPPAIAKAHPHLMLVLEAYDRASLSAEQNNPKKVVEQVLAARAEEKIFRTLMAQLGHPVAEGKR